MKAKRSPCYNCSSIERDKDLMPCDACMRPVHYALGMIDARLIQELFARDEQKLKELSRVIINERYLNHQSISVDVKLDLRALKHGWPNHNAWLKHLYLTQMLSPGKIADVTKISATAIKARLAKQGVQLRTRKESAGRIWTDEEKKKASKACKGRTPGNKGHAPWNKGADKYAEDKTKPAPLCACGCGKKVKWHRLKGQWNKYIFNHHHKSKK